MNNCYDKALDIILKANRKCICNMNNSKKFVIGSVNEGEKAEVTIKENGNTEIINFVIPKGSKGDKGENGTSVKILGSYNTYDDLIREHNIGNIGDSYIVDEDLYVWSNNTNTWDNVGKIKGPKGDNGPQKIKSSYLVTFNNNNTYEGLTINSLERLPIGRIELDIDKLINLNSNDNTISFNETGYYKISFIINARIMQNNDFDPNTDFISIGLREVNTDNIYIGSSKFIYNNSYNTLNAEGIISVIDTNKNYELVNLSKKDIYLNTPDIINIKSNSYFTNPLISIIIEYLGN